MFVLVFCNYLILGGHILNISKTIFPKLILHVRISYQLHDVRLQEFYIHSPYVKNHCIKKNFNVLLSRANYKFFLDINKLPNSLLQNFWRLHVLVCCCQGNYLSEIISIFSTISHRGAHSNSSSFGIVWNTCYIMRSFCCVLGYGLF